MEEKYLEEISQLKSEVEFYQSKNIQAADFGLQILEEKNKLCYEKEDLEKKLEELQGELENAKHEFHLSKKALYQTQNSTKKAFCEGELRETDLDKQLQEAEERLETVEKEKEVEVYQLQNIIKNSNSEIERISALNNDISMSNQTLEHQRHLLRKELKELRANQAHLDACYSELEEENVTLQKQVSNLKETQVEYEGLKYEIRRLNEDCEYYISQFEETIKLKEMLERQLEDAHQTIKKEREIKIGLKRELSRYENIDLTAISLHSPLLDDNRIDKDADVDLDHPLIRHITSDLMTSGRLNENGNDLYSELTFSEISKLKQQLYTAEQEKILLINDLREKQLQLENKSRESDEKDEKDETINKMNELQEELFAIKESEKDKKENLKKLDGVLKDTLESKRSLLKEVECLHAKLSLQDQENQESTEKLQTVSDRISQLYHRLCLSNGDVPRQVMLEGAKQEAQISQYEEDKSLFDQNSDAKEFERNEANDSCIDSDYPTQRVLVTMTKQMCCLETAVDNLLHTKDNNSSWSEDNAENQETQEQIRVLEEEVLRLKSLLSSKREQIATLRTVLKANKHTAEVAISNLKEKYQHEKVCIP